VTSSWFLIPQLTLTLFNASPCLLYLLKCKTRFFSLQFGTQICEVILNSHMKHRTGPCRAKSRPASPNHVKFALFWHIMRHRVLISYTEISGQPIGPVLKGQEIQKREHSVCEVNWHNLFFLGLVHNLIF